jgi:hypothetical protein
MLKESKEKEQSRITLAIVFLTAYLSIFLGFDDKVSFTLETDDIIKQIIYLPLIGGGVVISLIFFSFLVFSALSLSSNPKKEVIFDQIVSDTKLEQIKDKFFNAGIRAIFLSFTYPIWYFFFFLLDLYGFLKGSILEVICLALIYILLHLFFKDDKIAS